MKISTLTVHKVLLIHIDLLQKGYGVGRGGDVNHQASSIRWGGGAWGLVGVVTASDA